MWLCSLAVLFELSVHITRSDACSQTTDISFTSRIIWKWQYAAKAKIRNNLRIPIITKTHLYNFDPLKPHFYIVKLGFTGVYIIFLISAQNIDCGYSLEPPRRGGSNEYPKSMFRVEIWKISRVFYLNIFSFWWWNFPYIWIGVFS